MPSDKAPRPDGFPILFYKIFWDVLKFDLFNMFNDFYNGKLQLGLFNFGNAILLHKKSTLIKPISLINCFVKIILEVLANRLKHKIE